MMNKEFVKNIIKAKKYEYQAIKEIMPDNLKKRLEEFEKYALNLLKDAIHEMIKEDLEEDNSKKITKKNCCRFFIVNWREQYENNIIYGKRWSR